MGLRASLRKIPPRATTAAALILIFAGALLLRIYFIRPKVFQEIVNFQGMDAWYHMRLVENLVGHFPHRINVDPYAIYPGGHPLAIGPMFDWMIASCALALSPRESPSKQLVDAVGAYVPSILGALLIFPVYAIGRAIFNARSGLLSAALVAILPGGLSYSLLGSTDHHIAESLFAALAMLFFVHAFTRARAATVSFNSLRPGNWRPYLKPLGFSLLAGLALSCYLLTWMRGAMLVVIIVAWAIIQAVIDYSKKNSSDDLSLIILPALLVAFLAVLPIAGTVRLAELHVASLAVGCLAVLSVSAVSRMLRRRAGTILFVLALAGAGALGLIALRIASPRIFGIFIVEAGRFTPGVEARTVAEARPLLFLGKSFSLEPAWERFTSGFFMALIALPILIYRAVREGSPSLALLSVWSAAMVLATLGENRFTYYLIVNVSLLCGYVSSWVLDWGGIPEPDKTGRRRFTRLARTLSVAAIAVWVFYPNFFVSLSAAGIDMGPDRDWRQALTWIRDFTPEPFGDSSYYSRFYGEPSPPRPAYSVMCWWDYGYWITGIAHRVPVSNPTQAGARYAAAFFTAQDESRAVALADSLKSRYAVVDRDLLMLPDLATPTASGKFPTLATWSGKEPSVFLEEFRKKLPDGSLVPLFVYYPEYYRSMAARLFLFHGKKFSAHNSSWVISFVVRQGDEVFKEITSMERFATEKDARAFLAEHPGSTARIAGINPLMSCVDLDPLKKFRIAYSSPTRLLSTSGELPSVMVFERFQGSSRPENR